MEFTGERVIPGQVEPDLWAEHFSRYRFAATLAPQIFGHEPGRKPDVLDIGCGAGYGTATLAEVAASATGIDLAPEAIEHARAYYSLPYLTYVPGSATDLPFPADSFDLITAFEVIEHLADPSKLLTEARRVLRPNGVFLVSTPNKTYYAETRGLDGPNPYHLHEFTFAEFADTLASVFPSSPILLQNHTDAFSFYEPNATSLTDARIETIAGSPTDAHFFLAVCSAQPLADLHSFVYVPTATNLLRTREHHIGILQAEVRNLKASIDGLQESLTKAHAERDNMIRMFDQQASDLAQRTEWAQRMDREFNEKVAHLKLLSAELEETHHKLIHHSAAANQRQAKLQAELASTYAIIGDIKESRWMRLGRTFGLGPKIEIQSPVASTTPETKHDV